MHDNWLVALALAASAVGIVGLLFALIVLEVPLSTIDAARMADDGTVVRITGTITQVQARTGMTIMTVSQPSTIDIIIDGNLTGNTTATGGLAQGSCVFVQGKKGTYRNASQISATRVMLCK